MTEGEDALRLGVDLLGFSEEFGVKGFFLAKCEGQMGPKGDERPP